MRCRRWRSWRRMRFSTAMCSFSQPHAGVPPVGENVGDVRMLQLEKNTAIISSYARQARNAGFRGLFCEVSDPVDPLAKAAWPRQQSRRHRRFSTDRDCCPEQVPGLRTRRDECARCLLCAQRRSLCAVSQRRPLLRRSPARSSLSPIPSKTTTTPLSAGTHHARPRSQSAHARARLQCRSWRRRIRPACSPYWPTLRGEDHYGSVFLGGSYMGVKNPHHPCRSAARDPAARPMR